LEIKDIEITIKEIKNILNKINLEKNDKENIKKISYGLYDELKSEKDEWHIYIFIDAKTKNVLKIGKDASDNKQRHKYQHYSIDAAQSTLAKDLYNDYIINQKNSLLFYINEQHKEILKDLGKKISEKRKYPIIPMEEEAIKELKENKEICVAFNKTRNIVRDWMKNKENIEKYIIKISSNSSIFILNFIESYFQLKYNPKFEGFKKQNKN